MMMSNAPSLDELIAQTVPGSKKVFDVPIATSLLGVEPAITLHVYRGRVPGPTLAVMSAVHGDESGSLPVIWEFANTLDTESLRGNVVLLPVANPFAFAVQSRFTPELHGNVDLHSSFPGNGIGTLTELIARTITASLLSGLGPDDAFVDMHSGGYGGRIQLRVDFDHLLKGGLRDRTIDLCRRFGASILHENNLARSASVWLNNRGVPTINVEVGGAFLDSEVRSWFVETGVEGLRNIGARLGVLPGECKDPEDAQLLFHLPEREEILPRNGGWLVSEFESIKDLGGPIKSGTVLGRILDPYRMEVVEELVSPVDGRMFFTRYSGLVEAGSKAFGVANEKGSRWL